MRSAARASPASTTPGASFGVPAAKLGLMVNHWTVQRIATLAGASTARAVLLAAEVVTGLVRIATGLYSLVVVDDMVDPIEYQHALGAALAAAVHLPSREAVRALAFEVARKSLRERVAKLTN